MIENEYVVQYAFPKTKEEGEEFWSDEGACEFRFDPENDKSKTLALAAARAYEAYCNHAEEDDEFPIIHRVVHRITSDLVVE